MKVKISCFDILKSWYIIDFKDLLIISCYSGCEDLTLSHFSVDGFLESLSDLLVEIGNVIEKVEVISRND